MTQELFNTRTLDQLEFDEYIDQLTDTTSPEIEIDSVTDDFGQLYRVWNGWQLLGTFYQNLEDQWVAQPCNSDERPCCETPLQAQLIILVVSGLLVADVA